MSRVMHLPRPGRAGSPSRLRRRRTAAVLAILGVVAILGACASGAGGASAGAPAANPDKRLSAGDVAAVPSSASNGYGPDAQYATTEQQIVKTGEITVQVADVAKATGQVRALALELGGYVGGAQAGTQSDAATLTLRIPAPRFDDALSRLHTIGDKVLVESTREQDVTSTVVDLNARIKNLQSSEIQYRTLMTKATKIEDILAIQSRLDDVQGQIEQLTAQLKSITNQADLATLTVTLQPQPEPIQAASSGWDPGETLSSAVGALLNLGQGLVTVGIWIAILGLPIAVVLAIVLLILARLGLLPRGSPQPPLPEA